MIVKLREVSFFLFLAEKCLEQEVDLSEYYPALQFDSLEEQRKCRELGKSISDLIAEGREVI